jgi:hypothetical protein
LQRSVLCVTVHIDIHHLLCVFWKHLCSR